MKTRLVIHIEKQSVVEKIDLPDGRYVADILTTDTRSSQQNRYYHGIVVPIVQHGFKDLGTDLSKQEVHEYLKSDFNYSEVFNQETGEYKRVPRSTTGLNKGEFKEYIEKIQRFAAEFLNVEIPDPGTQTHLTFSSALKK